MRPKAREYFRKTVLILFVLASLQLLITLVFGGYDITIGRFHISSHRPGNIFLIQIILAIVLKVSFSRKAGVPTQQTDIRLSFSMRKERRFILVAFIMIVILSGAAYRQVLPAFFVSDDFEYLHAFDQAKSLHPDILFGYLKAFGLLRPLPILSLYADFKIWHLNPLGYHVTSFVLHALNACLFLLLLLLLTKDKIFSCCGALLFSVYPVHPEAVAWISGRFDVLCATFYLLAVFLFVVSSAKSQRFHHLDVMSLLSFLFALLSKEMAFSLPLVLILIEAVFRPDAGPRSWKDRFRRHAPFWLVGVTYLAFRLIWLKGVGGYVHSQGGAFFKGLNVFDVRNLLLGPFPPLFLPFNSALYSHAAFLRNALLIVLSFAILFIPFRKRLNFPVMMFGLFVIILTVWPTLRIFFITPTLEGARFLYLPSLGASIILAALLTDQNGRGSPKKIYVVFPIILFFFFLMRNNVAWNYASKVSDRMLRQALTVLNEFEIKEMVYVVGLPDNYKGAYIFRNGFSSAVDLLGGRKSRPLIDVKNVFPAELKPNSKYLILEWGEDRFQLRRVASDELLSRMKK
jgi:hypothetical protein